MSMFQKAASMLGVAMNEPFTVTNPDDANSRVTRVCRVTESGFEWRPPGETTWKWSRGEFLLDVINGRSRVIKLRLPKDGDEYSVICAERRTVIRDKWSNSATDFMRLAVGNVFANEDEAFASMDEFTQMISKLDRFVATRLPICDVVYKDAKAPCSECRSLKNGTCPEELAESADEKG